jgi:short subunit dehydrogenase-like uncharacterized protein
MTGRTERPYEVVVYGATGFSGRQTVAYLASRAADASLRWAISGRDRAKLEALAATLPEPRPDVLVADARDPVALRGLASGAAVALSLIGPFGPIGDVLPDQCVAAGTHYADLCGENDVIAARISRLYSAALAARVKLIPACGYESVPFDLGAMSLDQAFREADGSRLETLDAEVRFVLHRHPLRLGHGTSGGTLTTVQRLIEAGDISDPFFFVDGAEVDPRTRAANEIDLAARRSAAGDWLTPLMPTPFLNPAIVHLTSALLAAGEDGGYSPELAYRESTNMTASMGSRALGAANAKAFSGLARRIAAMAGGRRSVGDRLTLSALRAISPKPGSGPSLETLDEIDYRIEMRARSSTGLKADARLEGRGNPGYRSAPNILAEAGIALARDDALPESFGVLTPASGLGIAFAARLPRAGLTIEVARPVPSRVLD